MSNHLIIACPHKTGWAVDSVSAKTKKELEKLAKQTLAEFLILGWLDLPKNYQRLGLSHSEGDPRNEYLLSELFKRARKMDLDCEYYVIYIGTEYMELEVPHPSTIPWNKSPMDVMIHRLIEEVKAILKEYDVTQQ